MHVVAQSPDLATIEELLNAGMQLTQRTRSGLSFAHFAARVRKRDDGVLPLRALMSHLTPRAQRYFARLEAQDGSRAIHFAAWAGNLDAIKYLVEELGTLVNPATIDGETPLSIALERGQRAIVDYLQSHGARAQPPAPQLREWTYEDLVAVITTYRVRTIDRLLQLLPPHLKSNRAGAVASQAVQEASPDFPLVTAFGRSGKLLLNFNGHESQRGYPNLEIIQYRESKDTEGRPVAKFEFREIQFPEPGGPEQVLFSQANPEKCDACHHGRPLWDNWTLWAGHQGGEMDERFPRDAALRERFERNRYADRYRQLPPPSLAPVRTRFGDDFILDAANTKLDSVLDPLMGRWVATEVQQGLQGSGRWAYRYAFLAALSCNEPIESFLTAAAMRDFTRTSAELETDTRARGTAELGNRIARHEAAFGGPTVGRYVVQFKWFGNAQSPDVAGRNLDVARTVRLRFLGDNLGLRTERWSTPFNGGQPSYANLFLSSFENSLWETLLSPSTDERLWNRFQTRTAQTSNSGIALDLFYGGGPGAGEVCQELKAKSLEALASLE